MAKSKPWALDPAEVAWGFYGRTTSARRKRRLSRELDSRAMEVKLTHIPTGIEAAEAIPEGHYSRKAMQEMRNGLYHQLFSALEAKVARHLRVRGR